MTTPRRLKKRKSADETFRDYIDEFVQVTATYKLANNRREWLRKKLRNMISFGHRGRGVHLGNQFAIDAHDVRRKRFSQDKARLLMGPKMFAKAFKTERYLQIDSIEEALETKESQDGQTSVSPVSE